VPSVTIDKVISEVKWCIQDKDGEMSKLVDTPLRSSIEAR
jgi:hypothetical protein